jgi:predicted O-methyltransferase YrrM
MLFNRWLNAARARREFSNFEERLASAMQRVPRIKDAKFPNDIPGWLTPHERQTLYALAFCLPGPILEIGSWVGLSTTALAMGIKDSGASKQFDTVDLNPPPEWFRPVGPDTIGFFPKDSLAPLGTCPLDSFEKEIEPIITAPGGQLGALKRTLAQTDLSSFVSVHTGDFRDLPDVKYNLVFCDALHDEEETYRNASALARFLTPGSILACHDISHNLKCIAILRQGINLGRAIEIDSLYISEVCQGDKEAFKAN